jgi:hypothetical protein
MRGDEAAGQETWSDERVHTPGLCY